MSFSLLANNKSLPRSSYLLTIFIIVFLNIIHHGYSLARVDLIVVDNNSTNTTSLSTAQNKNNNNLIDKNNNNNTSK